MSRIWVTTVVGSLTGVAAMTEHQRCRGVPEPPPALSWRGNRHDTARLGSRARIGLPVLRVSTPPRQQPAQRESRCNRAADRRGR